jgi:phosphoribosyl 1,2-cyclic phosphodiesterase
MELGILGSGSTGNAVWVQGDSGVLVDCGFSVRRTLERLDALGADPARLAAIVVTHEHSDHAGGVGPVARRLGVPVYASHGTLDALRDMQGVERHPLVPGRHVDVDGFRVHAFGVQHDASEPIGIRLEHGGRAVGILTDTGAWDEEVCRRLSDADALVVESNHDEDMLATGPYPAALKRRIQGNHGHLSNRACARLLARTVGARTRRVVLGHLSRFNNTPELALATSHAVLERARRVPRFLDAAGPSVPIGPFSV